MADAKATYLVMSRCRDSFFREMDEELDTNDSLSGARRGVRVEAIFVGRDDARVNARM